MRVLVDHTLVMSMLLAVASLVLASPSGATNVAIQIIDSTGDGGGNTLDGPAHIAVDASGNVYVISLHEVYKITPGGTITVIIDFAGDGGGNTFGSPKSIAADASGNVYVTSGFGDHAFRIETPGTCSTTGTPCTITEIIDSTGDGGGNTLDAPHGVAVDASGNVYVTGSNSSNAFRIETPGACSTTGTPCTITEIIDSAGGLNGVTVDASSNVYVVARSGNHVFRIETPGTCSTTGTPCTITEIIDYTGDGSGNTLRDPHQVAVDAIGNVYLTGYTNAFKIATPGTCSTTGTPCAITEIIDQSADQCGRNRLIYPFGIDTDASGNVYVSGLFSDNVFKILPVVETQCVGRDLVGFEWSGVVPVGDLDVLTNPNISTGESWTLTYIFNTSLADLSGKFGQIEFYIDPTITPTISFSGGYSTPVGGAPGIRVEAWDGMLSNAIVTRSVSGDMVASVAERYDSFFSAEFPPDGTWSGANGVSFSLDNADGVISYSGDNSLVTVTITTLVLNAGPALTTWGMVISLTLFLIAIAAARRSVFDSQKKT